MRMIELGGYVVPDYLRAGDVVMSFGVGWDVEFERGLRDRFGCHILLYDPTPPALESVATLDIVGMTFRPIGAAEYDGVLTLRAPGKPGYTSYSINGQGDAVDVEVRRISTLIAQDLPGGFPTVIKLDIEGTELAVVNDMATSLCIPRVICIDVHDPTDVPRIARLLPDHHRFNSGQNHTFVR